MAKGGLQDNTPVSLPSQRPTCTDAVSTSLGSQDLADTSMIIQDLPDLINQLHLTPSLSDYDSSSASSLDTTFEISKFGNLKFESTFIVSNCHNFPTRSLTVKTMIHLRCLVIRCLPMKKF